MNQVEDDGPALLLTEHRETKENLMLINERKVVPKLKQSSEQVESNLWYLDNGASNHMTGQRSKFKELNENVTGQVRFGDGSTVDIKGKGSVILSCKNGEERILDEVYFIPMLRNNIISLGQLSEVGNKAVLNGEYLWVYDTQRKLLMKVKRSPNRLYKIIIETAKDDYSHWTWVYMLKGKDEALAMFKSFKARVENGTEKRVKTLRTDRGGEFCSKDFEAFCAENGITRQYTTPYSPQQNGVVERRNRTVVAMAHSLLKQMELPMTLWGEAVRHSVYLLNRLPTSSING
ncbi:uncharacterized protein LOC141725137 [Apium graveolens]|uniref:uncharacterized protein LOC141725137 n=1 Tax=Apium graveolens TaxID=4045 RepID=UPI003D7B9283